MADRISGTSIGIAHKLQTSVNQLAIELGLLAILSAQWWIGEIRAMMPRQLAPRDDLVVGLIDDDIYVFEGGVRGRLLTEADVIRNGVILHLDQQQVLRRTLQLPMQARLGLHKILANDLERQSPIDPSRLLFTYRLLSMDRDAARITVSLAMVRREEIDTAVARLNASGLQVKTIRADNAHSQPADDFVLPQDGSFKFGCRERLLTGLMVFLLCAGASDGYLRFARTDAQISNLVAEAENLAPSAAQAGLIRQEIETDKNFNDFLMEKRAEPSLGAILADITERLPDGTWLYGLSYDGHQIEMQGYSTNASDLAVNFDASRLFANANFRAPMTQGPNPGLQQFDLAMSLAETNK